MPTDRTRGVNKIILEDGGVRELEHVGARERKDRQDYLKVVREKEYWLSPISGVPIAGCGVDTARDAKRERSVRGKEKAASKRRVNPCA
ncbi:hypothetical protein B296_00018565, partial [Ensete ventricosum]